MLKIVLESDKVELGSGTQALWRVRVRNIGAATTSASISVILRSLVTVESGRTWTSPTIAGVSGNDASGSGSISDSVMLASGAEVVYYVTSTLNENPVSSIAGSATDSDATVTDTIRFYQGNMNDITFGPGTDLNYVQAAELFFNDSVSPTANVILVDWLEQGKTLADLLTLFLDA